MDGLFIAVQDAFSLGIGMFATAMGYRVVATLLSYWRAFVLFVLAGANFALVIMRHTT